MLVAVVAGLLGMYFAVLCSVQSDACAGGVVPATVSMRALLLHPDQTLHNSAGHLVVPLLMRPATGDAHLCAEAAESIRLALSRCLRFCRIGR